MSALPTHDETSTTPAALEPRTLRNLYAVRFTFAIAWAVALLASGTTSLDALTATLLVIYPLFDVAAAAYDLRFSGVERSRRALVVNMTVSLLAAVGLTVAAGGAVSDVLRVWGAWAVVAGIAQLVVGLKRYRLGGQRPMILSGAISVLAGAGFAAMASGHDPSLGGLAGYATLGGIFFGISAVSLSRRMG